MIFVIFAETGALGDSYAIVLVEKSSNLSGIYAL
jgi:hypothetical protein